MGSPAGENSKHSLDQRRSSSQSSSTPASNVEAKPAVTLALSWKSPSGASPSSVAALSMDSAFSAAPAPAAPLPGSWTDVYAVRYHNARTGKGGWIPAVRGGWRKGVPHEDRNYLPLTPAVLATHLKGDAHIGLYPPLDGDRSSVGNAVRCCASSAAPPKGAEWIAAYRRWTR